MLLVGGCTSSTTPAPSAGGTVGHGPATVGAGTAAPAPAPEAGACPGTTMAAQIGGATTCLAAGQACTKAYRDQYPTYGFLCLPKSTQYVLFKK